MLYNSIRENIEEVLSKEIQGSDLKEAMEFIDSQATISEHFIELNNNSECDSLISLCILLGMGRNRTVEILKDFNVNRKTFEQVRDNNNLKDNLIKEENEKAITNFKWNTKTRLKRHEKLAKVDWEEMKRKYAEGQSPNTLRRDYNISSHLIIKQLEEEGLFDYNRSTLTKNKTAKEKAEEIDNGYIIRLIEDNPLLSMDFLWRKSAEKYPWILRSQFLNKVEELGLTRTKLEVNEIKRIKSKVAANKDYMTKVKGYKAVTEVFGSDEELTKEYLAGNLGSYKSIADKINKEINFNHEISERQVERIVRNSANYKSRKSLGQVELYKLVKNSLIKLEVLEEYNYEGNKRIDIYIPELKLGIEFNGDYWHSDAIIEHNYRTSSYNFHKERVDEAAKSGIKLIYVWENDFNTRYEEIEQLILNRQWESKLLNKYESDVKRNFKESKKRELLLDNIINFLNENEIGYEIATDSNEIIIADLFMSINTKLKN